MGVSQIQAVRARVTEQCETLAQSMESRAAFVARRGAPFAGATLPPSKDWHLLLAPFHRTKRALDNATYNCCAFAQAQIACMAMRGEDTAHLFPYDNIAEPQVCSP